MRNIKEKKLRTLLILFSIAMASALLFASLGIGDTITNLYLRQITSGAGSSDLVITADKNSQSPYVSSSLAMKEHSVLETVGAFIGAGSWEKPDATNINVELKGYELSELQHLNPFDWVTPVDEANFTGKKMIINQAAAKAYSLSVGSIIEIKIMNQNYKFEIAGIAQPKGPFYENGRTLNTVVPKDTLAALMGARGKNNTVYVVLKDPQTVLTSKESLEMLYRDLLIKQPYTAKELEQFVGQVTTPFLLMTIMVLFMSVFIIYTSFKVITLERLPVIGTFRSIGATRKTTDLVMLLEAIAYGAIGGIIGIGLGFGILAAMTYTIMSDSTTEIQLFWQYWQIGAGLLLAMGMALFSAMIPIIQVSKIPVKEIVLNNWDQIKRKKRYKKPFGVVLLILSFVVPPLMPLSLAILGCVMALLCACLSATILVPEFTKLMVRILEPIFTAAFGNIGMLAAKNIRDNKSILTNISLLAIGLSTIILIVTMSNSVNEEVGKAFKDFDFEIWVGIPEADRGDISRILATEGVDGVYPSYSMYALKVKGQDKALSQLKGIDTLRYNDFYNLKLTKEWIKQLEADKTIILGDVNRITYGFKVGDNITFETENGDRTYKIIGFQKTLMNNGQFGLVSSKNLKMDFPVQFYDDIFVKSKTPDEVAVRLKEKFNDRNPWVETISNLEVKNQTSNAQIFTILKGFSFLAMVIGIFGVLNNLLISFIQRRRHMAIFRSVGMSQKQIIQMILIEAVVCGMVGGFAGILLTLDMLYIVPYILPVMAAPIPIHYDLGLFSTAVIAAIVITVVASLSPALKSSKLNIIEAIKFE